MSEIVLVHGLWNRGWSMAVIARRLRARGYGVRIFSYSTRRNNLDGQADELREFVSQIAADELHFVGHSMGGLVILNLLDRYAGLPPGRVVLMGTPVKGSGVARRLANLPGQKILFGKARESLQAGFARLPPQRETGMILGTRALGIGRLAGHPGEASDGTVARSETQLDGLADSIELRVAHTGMLVSAEVVEQLAQFILNGRFRHRRQAGGDDG